MTTEVKDFQLVDDGTLDTVLECDNCRETTRYTFDGCGDGCEGNNDGSPACECYARFVDWALEDAPTHHECRS